MKIPRKHQVDFTGKKFLIVDDFGDMRSMLRNMVESYGVSKIDGAANGKDALNAMAKKDYDVILCDYNLGEGKDGQQVLEEAKHKSHIKFSTVFMMITAENTLHMVMGAVEYQPDDYMSKPFNKHSLRQRLEKIILKKSDFEGIERVIKQGDLPQAILLCDQRIKDKPANLPEFQKLMAELYIKTAQLDEAEKVYADILSQRNVPWAQMGLGKISYINSDYEKAREIFQEVIQNNKNNVEAYDWLSKTLVELEDIDSAEEYLIEAAKLSPKAIQRQMVLGDLALENKRYSVAAKAFKKAVQVGKYSVYKTPDNYTKQARALVHTSAKKDALRVLKNIRKDFPRDEKAGFQATLCEHIVLNEMDRKEEAQQAFVKASEMFEKIDVQLPADLVLEMSQAYIVNGDKEKGTELIKDLVRNHHENDELLNKVQRTFSEIGMEDEGKQIIFDSREKVVQLNNQGVQLVQEGLLEDAIALFQEALDDMPDNKTINSNTAMVLIRYMEQHGKDDQYLTLAQKCLDMVKERSTADVSFVRLQERFFQLNKNDAA